MKNLAFLIVLSLVISCNAQEEDFKNYKRSLSEIIESEGCNESEISILIDKSDYKLTVQINKQVLKEYPVVFGENTSDDKLMEGDICTPEGDFNIITKYPHKKWSKFIWINYPNEDSWEKHNAAKRNDIIPQDAKIGGEVGIHGVPMGMDNLIDTRNNWTLGCISMKNNDVDELYPYVLNSTIISIRK